MNIDETYSDYWLGDLSWDIKESNIRSATQIELLKLSSARKAVKNYVTILSGKNYPVYFSGDKSATDGNAIVIGSDIIDRKKFDVNVGLTLHETSHLIYSDFNLLKNVWRLIPDELHNLSGYVNIQNKELIHYVSYIWNYIEDRYIDKMVTLNCPGYFPYYRALYDKYFGDKIISKALKSNLYRTPSMESYLYRITNMTNKNTDVDALPGLRKIFDIINLNDILRLEQPIDRLECTFDVLKVILLQIDKYVIDIDLNNHGSKNPLQELQDEFDSFELDTDQNESSEDTKSKVFTKDKNENNVSTEDNNGESETDKNCDGDLDDILGGKETEIDKSSDKTAEEKLLENLKKDSKSDNIDNIGEENSDFSQSQLNKIKRIFSNQKDLLTGNVKKKRVKKKEIKQIKLLEENGVEIIKVGSEYFKNTYDESSYGKLETECIFANHVKESSMVDPNGNGFYLRSNNTPGIYERNQDCINSGIQMGIKIGKKLQIRNEELIEKYTRRENGRFDKKLLNEAAIGLDNIFYTTSTTRYKKTHFHIDLDMSSSMQGNKYREMLTLMTAIAKACTMLDGVSLKIGMRSTHSSRPYYAVVYDSKLDKFSKIKNSFKYIYPIGTTPEGLCFESALKMLSKTDRDMNKIFINISDGLPMFNMIDFNEKYSCSFRDEPSLIYTRKQVNKIRELGYEVISYFISDYTYTFGTMDNLMKNFRMMYGKDAKNIKTNNVTQIHRTLSDKLSETYTV